MSENRLGPKLRAQGQSESRGAHLLADSPADTISKAPRPAAKGTALNTDNCTWLNIAYSRKDQVKQLGAKWDSLTKRWYVPHYISLAPFAEAGLLKTGSDKRKSAKGGIYRT